MKSPICPYCGSDQVVKDAFAEWDIQQQEWVLYAAYDDGYCQDCENTISSVELVEVKD